ncbi:enoyl-CoA hydratase/isomerase family protein [Paenarthrobacter aurescens]|uniref:3-hydroxyisobutyryl-CoA hydrolase n=1 Tax=Paenarthrobacter aurescens TaxID=43663 RepID=A0A4Y3NFM3_PAEAU|nr:enoyl-CoA hydratase/isomerase family protein [Paenarthrobacter aurescens]MDO6142132.1 enoyl-CoA hydratase/isomerase family protein [Paenarthrobacter aurescens]MDO6145980.1 enoyl-CoA hydratase/isomerase family protein [Paenarthrobacter aurescens]MDO6157224.1 enoyl-CoA hydratase/isomerase family protein [Paenarthrobacter aurescens]MDO6161209.1 enoyl-CoA hydratase/isomerase family protein [Paenarthrobacter aurescens]GEB20063.1 3-hydroxyisobutyryl-CoA hydrolase [Paenarthrobacter aurescens]
MGAEGVEEEVLFERRGHLGIVTLNRPKAVNALNHGMVQAMLGQLSAWADDDAVATVVLRGAGDRGLCAGGDIVAIYKDMLHGGTETAEFWADEYRLNALISHYPKPYVAFMDGLVLGGGVGVSAHGSVRVVTERTRTGMPETTIGFVPDVGGTLLLSRSPGEAGTHAALTGAHLSGADALFLGLADHFVPSQSLPALAEALESSTAEAAVGRFAQAAPDSALAAQLEWIDAAYAREDAEEIVRSLRTLGDEAAAAADTIEAKSPTSVKVTLESLRRVRGLSLEEALDQEYRVGLRCLAGPDFREGIRAQVVDKDRNPQWKPPSLAEVRESDVEGYFAPLGERELGLSAAPVQSN